jgi:hypothetical protein
MRSHWHPLQMNHFNDMSQVRRRKGCKQNHEQQVGAEGGMRMGSKPPGTTDDEPTQRTRPGKQVRGRPTVVRPRGGHKGEPRGGGGARQSGLYWRQRGTGPNISLGVRRYINKLVKGDAEY